MEEDFIGYDASPDVDRYFLEEASRSLLDWRSIAGLHPDFKFGPVKGIILTLTAWAVASLHMKHIMFCMEYLKKYPIGAPANVFTIWTEKKELVDTIASLGGLPRNVAYKALSVLSLGHKNANRHARSMSLAFPSLIEGGRRFWIRPASSAFVNPLYFAVRELRRSQEKLWNKNVKIREEWFREDLYALFMGNRFWVMNESRQLKRGRGVCTDIDAAIVDVETGTLALFELKWHEPFDDDESERISRAKNLLSGVKHWEDSIIDFIATCGLGELLNQVCGPGLHHSAIKKLKLFALARNHAQFSGFNNPCTETVVVSWRHFCRVRLELGAVDDTFYEMYNKFKTEEIDIGRLTFRPVSFCLGDYSITVEDLFFTST